MNSTDKNLLSTLLHLKVIDSASKLDPGLCTKYKPIAALAANDTINEREVLTKLADHLCLSYLDLEEKSIKSKCIISKYSSLDSKLLWEAKAMPLYEEDGLLVVAMANPLDQDLIKAISFGLSLSISPVIAEESKITKLLHQYFPDDSKTFDMIETPVENYVELIDDFVRESDTKKGAINSKGIIQLVDSILSDAILKGASDVHIEPSGSTVAIRFRIDGQMHEIVQLPKRLQPYTISRLKLISGMDISEKRRPQDGRFGVSIPGSSTEMRVSCIPTAFGEKIVLRLMLSSYEGITFGTLGFGSELESKFQDILGKKDKALLVTGPTGFGKTTTLYCCVNQLNDGSKNITTVEDPIEYRFEGVNQIQVNSAIDVTFASALRSILRQDPDVIMVGEIRDRETMEIALKASQTGHLVLSTLHTNSAPGAVCRLRDLGAEPFLITSTVAGILAQRLVRKICQECVKEETQEEIERYRDYLELYNLEAGSLKRGSGCEHCHNSGYSGRLGVYSFLEMTDSLAKQINNEVGEEELIRVAKKHSNYRGLDEAAAEMLRAGVTTLEEAVPYLYNTIQGSDDKQEEQGNFPINSNEKKRILLIDDSKIVRKLLTKQLSDLACEIEEAENGVLGMDAVFSFKPHVILCDLTMPEMDGKSFLKNIKDDKRVKDIPVVILTGDGTNENEAELISLGARDFVKKSCSQEVIKSRLKAVFQSLKS